MQQEIVDRPRASPRRRDIAREDGEGEAAFEDRLAQAVDDYINIHNFTQSYKI